MIKVHVFLQKLPQKSHELFKKCLGTQTVSYETVWFWVNYVTEKHESVALVHQHLPIMVHMRNVVVCVCAHACACTCIHKQCFVYCICSKNVLLVNMFYIHTKYLWKQICEMWILHGLNNYSGYHETTCFKTTELVDSHTNHMVLCTQWCIFSFPVLLVVIWLHSYTGDYLILLWPYCAVKFNLLFVFTSSWYLLQFVSQISYDDIED